MPNFIIETRHIYADFQLSLRNLTSRCYHVSFATNCAR